MQHVLTTHPISAPIARQSAAKWSYVSLIYSLFYFFPVALGWEQSSLSQIMAAIAVYALFIALFLRAVHSFGSSSIAPILGIIALSSIGSSINSGCNALFGYAAFLSSYYFNARLANLFLLFNLCAQLVTALLLDIFHLYYLGPSVAVTVSLFVYGRFSQKDCVHQLEAVSKNEQIEQLATIAE